MHRREFITFLGGVSAVWSSAARAERSKLPTIGFLGGATALAGASAAARTIGLDVVTWKSGEPRISRLCSRRSTAQEATLQEQPSR